MKKFIYLYLLMFFLLFFFSSKVVLAETARSQFNNSLKETAKETGHDEGLASKDVLAVSGAIIKIVLSLIGFLFLALMIYGGLIFMIARGNEQNTEKAMKIIRNAFIGLIIVFAAYAITAFVGRSLNRINLDMVSSSGIED